MSDMSFKDWQDKIKDELGKTEWITVYSIEGSIKDIDQGGFYCALIANTKKDEVLLDYKWDLEIGSSRPGLCSHSKSGKMITEYARLWDDGIEPLVHWRFFPTRNGYIEITEEFRLFFDLFEDRADKDVVKYFLFHNDGEEECIAQITSDDAKIKIKYIKEYLSIRQMHLAIYYSLWRFSKDSLDQLNLQKTELIEHNEDYIYRFSIVPNPDHPDFSSQSWLLGKKLIAPNLLNHPANRKYEEFIIDLDKNGFELLSTCEENKFGDFSGKIKSPPYYLTPTYFKKEVLQKYYNNPLKYEVKDGRILCKGFWSLLIDNNHPEHVMVFLGDIGKLSYKEQLHWKHHNIYAKGISKTCFERSFEGKFSDPSAPDLMFKLRFVEFQKLWHSKHGWYFFNPLAEKDQHHYESLHIPTTNEQKEFDEQVLSLVKVFIDSFNEEELARGLSIEKKDPKGIDKLELFLTNKNFNSPDMISFLRSLQKLRSTSVAHRKSTDKKSDYKKAKDYFKMEEKDLKEVFIDILIKCIWSINYLENCFLKKEK